MLSKRSLALTSVAYNFAAILTNLLVDILAPGPFAQCFKNLLFYRRVIRYSITVIFKSSNCRIELENILTPFNKILETRLKH